MSIPRIQTYPMPTQLPAGKVGWAVAPARAALLVHDMQQYFVDFYDPRQPPVPELVANIGRLLGACRKAGIPIVYTAQPGDQDPRDRALLTDFWGPGLGAKVELTRILPQLAPQAGDTVMSKWRYSAFKRSELESWLKAQGRDQLLICGVYAHIGCLMTAAEAFMLDIQAFMIGDALADFSQEEHEQALAYAAARCAQIVGTGAVLQACASVDADAPFDLRRLRRDVAAQIEIAAGTIEDDDDLLLLGLDSVRLMALVEDWRGRGLAADFAGLAEQPTIAAWALRLCAPPAGIASRSALHAG